MELITPGIGLIFWMTLVFGILLVLLKKFVWPVILKMLKDREESIGKALQAAEVAKQEMEHLQSRNEEMLKQARSECDIVLHDARMAGEKLRDEARQQAHLEVARILENARQTINYEKLQALTELKNQIATLSIEIAEKVLEKELSNKENAKELVDKQVSNLTLN